MKTPKHDSQYDEAIKLAQEDFRRPDGREMKDKCPYLFSSNMADAYWITAYLLYHTASLPRLLHKSVGHTWIADISGRGLTRVEVTRPDHRVGVYIHD